jgi:hypothetical protein
MSLTLDVHSSRSNLTLFQIYETRVKPLSSSPIFNAGTERLLRDWRHSHVTVAIKDSRVRENDAVLGIVFLKVWRDHRVASSCP